MKSRPFVYTPEDINKEFTALWKALRRNKSGDVGFVNLGVGATDGTQENTLQFNDNGDVWYVDTNGNILSLGGITSNTIYTGDNALAGNRTVDLNSFFLTFDQAGSPLLSIDPVNFLSVIQATDAANGTSVLSLTGDAVGSDVAFALTSTHAGTIVSILGSGTTDDLFYSAQDHLFEMENNGTFSVSDGVTEWVRIDVSAFSSELVTTDLTAMSSLRMFADAVTPDVRFELVADDGNVSAGIFASIPTPGVESALNYGATIHQMTANAHTALSLDGEIDDEESYIQAVNSTAGQDNVAQGRFLANPTNADFLIRADYHSATKLCTIQGTSVAASATIVHTADSHTFTGRVLGTQGADVASLAGAISLGNGGNAFEITGTNAITLISNVGWQNGSVVMLVFTAAATLTDGVATSTTNVGMELAGNVNFVASADDVVTLLLCEVGGVQRWREVSRSVN